MQKRQAPPGWYPAGDSERWWDGTAWTEHARTPDHGGAQVVDAHGLSHAPAPGTAPAPFATPPGAPTPAGTPAGASWPRPVQTPAGASWPPPRPMPAVAPRSAAPAVLASVFLPGLGSMVNGDIKKGLGIMAGYVVSVFASAIVIGVPGVIAFWVWGVVDAAQGAHRWNRRHGWPQR